MKKSATIRARMDPQLKEEAEAILEELGISATEALTIFYKQIRLNKGLPFEVRLPEGAVAPARSHLSARTSSQLPVHEHRTVMEQNIAAYRSMHSDLVENYLGQYVAIIDGKLVDHNPDPLLLLECIRLHYPDQIVLRRKVERTPERELRIRHPKFERVS